MRQAKWSKTVMQMWPVMPRRMPSGVCLSPVICNAHLAAPMSTIVTKHVHGRTLLTGAEG